MNKVEFQSAEMVGKKPRVRFLEKLRAHKGKILVGILIVFVLAGAVFVGYQIGQIQEKRRQAQSRAEQVESMQCDQNEDCVLAIRLDQCCRCPTAVSRAAIQEDEDLVDYEFGKDLRDYRIRRGVNCQDVLCKTCVLPTGVICSEGKCGPKYETDSNPTANWQTYTNTEYDYSVRYPPDWNLGTDMMTTLTKVVFNKDDYSLLIDGSPPKELSRPPHIMIATTKVRVGEKDYLKSTWKHPDGKVDFERINLDDNLEIVLRYKDNLYNEEYETLFNLILSTFRFLDSTGSGGEEETCIKDDTNEEMSLTEAREIALASECVEEGSLKEAHSCNQYTGTWWLDLNIQKEGCAPICVVNVATKKAEINWRCTGLITPCQSCQD